MNLTELQIDILKERFNIAVGHAATRYCEMTGGMREVFMSTPRLKDSLQKKLDPEQLSTFYVIERTFVGEGFQGSLSLVATRRSLLHFFSIYAGFDCDENTALCDSLKSELLQVVDGFLSASFSMLSFQLKKEFQIEHAQWLTCTAADYLFKPLSNEPFLVSIEFSPEGLSTECFLCLKLKPPGLEKFGHVLQSSFELTDSSP